MRHASIPAMASLQATSWDAVALAGHGPYKLPDRWRVWCRRVPHGAEEMEADLRSVQWPEVLPGSLGELYDFYVGKVQRDVATERVLVQQLQSVSRLTRHRLWSSFVFVFVLLVNPV